MVELFNKKPFQGQAPEKASIVFLSSDANYSPEISKHPFFNEFNYWRRTNSSGNSGNGARSSYFDNLATEQSICKITASGYSIKSLISLGFAIIANIAG